MFICVLFLAGCSIEATVENTKSSPATSIPTISFSSTISAGKFEGTSVGYSIKGELSVAQSETTDSGYVVKGGIQ